MALGYSFTDITTPTDCTATPVAGGSLLVGVTYYYRIVAVINSSSTPYLWYGKSKMSAEFSGTTDASNRSMEISFSMPEGEVGSYRIFRVTSSGGHFYPQRGCIAFSPSDATYNSGGIVTFTDTGYADNQGNNFLENSNDAHGVLTLSGSTLSEKFSIVDLYEADVANGWGVIERLSSQTYKINTYLVCHANQYWADQDKTIIFADSFAGSNSADWQFGLLAGTAQTYAPCNIIFENCWLNTANFGILNAYATTFEYRFPEVFSNIGYGFASGTFYSGSLINCTVSKFRGFLPYGGSSCTLKNFTMMTFDNAFGAYAANNDGVNMLGGSRAWQLVNTQSVTARGVYTESSYPALWIGTGAVLNLIDSIIDGSGLASGAANATLNDQISFNLNVVDDNGDPLETVNLKIIDKDLATVVDTDTDASGDITEQIVTRRIYNIVAGSASLDERFPFRVLVTKAGYQNYDEIVSYDSSDAVVKTLVMQELGVANATKLYDTTLYDSTIY